MAPSFHDLDENSRWVEEFYKSFATEEVPAMHRAAWLILLYNWVELEREQKFRYCVRKLSALILTFY